MTDEEFEKIISRVIEITETLELCDPSYDQDVLQNLLGELEEMNNIITQSLEDEYNKKPKLRLIKEDE